MPESPARPSVPGRALFRRGPRGAAKGAVLFLHGGTPRSEQPVGSTSGSLWRMGSLRNAIGGALIEDGYAVWLLRYAVRGWNAELGAPAPVADARWALSQITASRDLREGGPRSLVLLGHSMGARTGAYVADHPAVIGLVALAPWFDPADPTDQLAGKQIVAGHGRRDRITSARQTRAYLERAVLSTHPPASAEFVDMGPTGHYLLHRAGKWRDFALHRTRRMLRESLD